MNPVALTRRSINFRQALYELFGIGKDLTGLMTEEDKSFEEWHREQGDVFDRWSRRLNDRTATAHCTVQIYAQFMPELSLVSAD